MLKNRHTLSKGAALIEAMITVVILIFGLLGLVGLQSRMATAEMESYQRSQAIILVNDMVQRIATNPQGASCYVADNVGIGTPPVCDALSAPLNAQVTADLLAWHNALQGAAEKTSGGTSVGAMIGARGCIVDIGDPASMSRLLVTVAWQGLSETIATPVACGTGLYKAPGASTASDAARRTLSVAVGSARLSAP